MSEFTASPAMVIAFAMTIAFMLALRPVAMNVSLMVAIGKKLGWKPTAPLIDGIAKTYSWIESQVKLAQEAASGTEVA